MNKYNDSKVYKIVDNTNGNIYVGSTTNKYLCQRLAKHKDDYKRYLEGYKNKYMTSFKILENGNYNIMLLENVNCEIKDQLNAKERYYIETLECVNKKLPGRTIKEYYIDNRQNKLEKANQYYKDNKENVRERLSKIFECECGSSIRKGGKILHCKSKKHQAFCEINK